METVHEMERAMLAPSGTEEWNCPICGRRLLIWWAPRLSKQVLVRGNETVTHTGGKRMLGVFGWRRFEEPPTEPPVDGLAPWRKYFDQVGL